MAGICGYCGFPPSNESVIDAMSSTLTRIDGLVASIRSGSGYAIASAGLAGTTAVVEHRDLIVVAYGHPRWIGGDKKDTVVEVLQRLADRFRVDAAKSLIHLGGDFSIALLDLQDSSCLLAVDRIGVRNLVFQHRAGQFLFGSTCDAVIAHPSATRSIDPQQIYNYVYFHMVPGPRTIYRDLQRVPPGHYVQFSNGRLHIAPYWEMDFDRINRQQDFAAMKSRFLDRLARSVESVSDVAGCGAFLSGGTDSSTISGMLGKTHGSPPHTYSIGFAAAGYDEMEYARIAARHFGAQHSEYYVTPEDVVSSVPRVAKTYDQPFGNASAIPTFHCARVAKEQGITRMLAGDGGDELYGGNARYAKQAQLALYDRIPSPLRQFLLEPVLMRMPESGFGFLSKARSYVSQASIPMPQRYEGYNLIERLGAEVLYERDFLGSIDVAEPHKLMGDIYFSAHASHWLNRVLAVDLRFTLADSDLPKVTRMCELAGVDVAFPMLNEEVVDFSAELTPELKLKGTRLRYFFKEALRGFLPDEILSKEKHGFGLPVGPWLETTPALKRLAFDALEQLKTRHIIRAAFIDELLGRYLKEHAGYYGTLVWVLMMLELWFQEHQ